MLEKNKILSSIRKNIAPTLYIYDQVDSTNLLAKKLADNCKDATIVLAKSQTAAYGRFGRSFDSPEGGLYMSIVLKGKQYTQVSLTAHAAICVAKALDNFIEKKICIKWINDLIIDNKKLCGISCESRLDTNNQTAWFVLGIGINVFSNIDNIKPQLRDKITSLSQHTTKPIDLNLVASSIVNNIFDISKDNKQIFEEYSQRIPFFGQKIRVNFRDHSIDAIAKSINEQGQLIVEYNGSILSLDNQEVSILI